MSGMFSYVQHETKPLPTEATACDFFRHTGKVLVLQTGQTLPWSCEVRNYVASSEYCKNVFGLKLRS